MSYYVENEDLHEDAGFSLIYFSDTNSSGSMIIVNIEPSFSTQEILPAEDPAIGTVALTAGEWSITF